MSFRFCCFRWVDTFCFILCCLFKLLDIKANGFFFFFGFAISVCGSNLVAEGFLMDDSSYEEDGEIFDDMDM